METRFRYVSSRISKFLYELLCQCELFTPLSHASRMCIYFSFLGPIMFFSYITNILNLFINRLFMLAGLGFRAKANSFYLAVGVQYNCILCNSSLKLHV